MRQYVFDVSRRITERSAQRILHAVGIDLGLSPGNVELVIRVKTEVRRQALGERTDKVRPVFHVNTFMDSGFLKIVTSQACLYTDLSRLLESVRLFVICESARALLARDLTHYVGILRINDVSS